MCEIVLTIDKDKKKLLVLSNTYESCPCLGKRGIEDSICIDIDMWSKDSIGLWLDEYEWDDEQEDGEYETRYEDYFVLKITPRFTGYIDIKGDIDIEKLKQSIKNCEDTSVKFIPNWRRVELM